jgi:hypothetical protein
VGGTEFVSGFKGSQALTICPSGKCKHITGTIEVFFYFFFGVGGRPTGCVRAKNFEITIGSAACEGNFKIFRPINKVTRIIYDTDRKENNRRV